MHKREHRKGHAMGKDYILVIDEGTTGTRAILFDKKFQIAEQ